MHIAQGAIDSALVAGQSAGSVARAHGLGADAVERHRKNHVAPQLAAAARLSAPATALAAPVKRARQIAAGAPPTPAERVHLDGLTDTLRRSLARLETAADDAAQGKALVALSALSGQITRAIDSVARLRSIGAPKDPHRQGLNLIINIGGERRIVTSRAAPVIEPEE
ncbi:hypothetical protein JYK14_19745 [Siccirubricoccus sp. KC 17139]|uniref:Transposase n=1 Tax=Siccirubricoccus soli TaxID=2899147 RepID=A0ABT1D901_9PROT|nr:hypothetical protein [Siccirubricoccus soli]MCO6418381.1 hypothetical protein [Siccirubricoccus soli]MCP2684516.1 hypothetical protein [Siccirubricoccus soli]